MFVVFRFDVMSSKGEEGGDSFWSILLCTTGGALNICEHSDISTVTFKGI